MHITYIMYVFYSPYFDQRTEQFYALTLLPSGSEQDQVLRGRSIPKEYLVIGELGVKDVLKVVRVVGNGLIET